MAGEGREVVETWKAFVYSMCWKRLATVRTIVPAQLDNSKNDMSNVQLLWKPVMPDRNAGIEHELNMSGRIRECSHYI